MVSHPNVDVSTMKSKQFSVAKPNAYFAKFTTQLGALVIGHTSIYNIGLVIGFAPFILIGVNLKTHGRQCEGQF